MQTAAAQGEAELCARHSVWAHGALAFRRLRSPHVQTGASSSERAIHGSVRQQKTQVEEGASIFVAPEKAGAAVAAPE